MEDAHPGAHNDANNLVNQLQTLLANNITAVTALQTELGSDPSGGSTTVKARFDLNDFIRGVNGVGFVVHGGTAGTPRPTAGYGLYIWIGTVQPTNWAGNDIYIDTSP